MAVDSLSNVQANHDKYAALFSDKSSNDLLNTETFFSLLMAEMSNQDPLEPTSNTEFVSQMAQFTALQAQQDSLYYTNANYASSLVGKTVTVAENLGGTDQLSFVTGTVTGLELTNKEFSITVNGKQYDLGNVMSIGTTQQSQQQETSQAANLIGKYVTIKVTDGDDVLYERGTVSSIEVQDGVTMVVVNDFAYKLSDIVEVKNEADKETEEGTDTDTDKKTTDTAAINADSVSDEDVLKLFDI